MKLSIIVAMSENQVVGCDNKLPWHLPEDLKNFKRITMGCPIIMGRKTFDSIGRLLPGRKNVILSRQKNLMIPGAVVVQSLDEAIAACKGSAHSFIIGGAELYRQALPKVNSLFITMIHKNFEGNTKFTELDLERDFLILSKEDHESNGLKYSFIEAARK